MNVYIYKYKQTADCANNYKCCSVVQCWNGYSFTACMYMYWKNANEQGGTVEYFRLLILMPHWMYTAMLNCSVLMAAKAALLHVMALR